MSPTHFVLDRLYDAMTLAERAAGARLNGSAIDPALAERRMKRWRSQTPFTDDTSFSHRLSMSQLTASEFKGLLGESGELLRCRFPEAPEWLSEIDRIYSSWAACAEPESAD